MIDTNVITAIEAALDGPAYCHCGTPSTVAVHDGAAWLECPTFGQPSRLPARIATLTRELLHDRLFIIEVGEALPRAA
jgi:hypothetical protein